MSTQVYNHRESAWAIAAEAWLIKALSDVRSGYDPIPAIDAALTAARIETGEMSEDPDLGG